MKMFFSDQAIDRWGKWIALSARSFNSLGKQKKEKAILTLFPMDHYPEDAEKLAEVLQQAWDKFFEERSKRYTI